MVIPAFAECTATALVLPHKLSVADELTIITASLSVAASLGKSNYVNSGD
jgi:DeoR/GlpR family transcriptional regulator of sugar metabolism